MAIKIVKDLADKLSSFPGVGEKKAVTIAHFLLKQPENYLKSLSKLISAIYDNSKLCPSCFNYNDTDIECSICTDTKRDLTKLCIVGEAKDVEQIELTGSYNGLYHVLHGYIDFMHGITPNIIKIPELLKRLSDDNNRTTEIIFAFNQSYEANKTIQIIKGYLPPMYSLSELGTGISIGSTIDNADVDSVKNAIKNRKEI